MRNHFVLAALLMLLAGCHASPPTAPSPTLSTITILYSGLTRPGDTFQAIAWAVDSDGAYRQVSLDAQWSSTNMDVARVTTGTSSTGSKTITTVSPGTAVVMATYEGLTGYLPVKVPADRLPANTSGPMRLTPTGTAAIQGPGGSSRLLAEYSGRNVTPLAEWASSDASVATVDRGELAYHRIGTTEITVTYQGVSATYFLSVHPATGRQ